MPDKNHLNQFTNLYELQKTLRFELKPVGNTQNMLEEDQVVEKDHLIKQKYEQTKPFFDRLHREFVAEALSDIELPGLTKYYEAWKVWQKDKTDKKAREQLEKLEKELRSALNKHFNAKAKEWAKEKYAHLELKHNNMDLFFKEGVFAILKERYGHEEKAYVTDETTGEQVGIFDSWKNFTGYFDKFHETRKNFYKDDGTSTAIATRAIDQNLKRFCENMQRFQSAKDKGIDFTEVEQNFDVSLSDVFDVNFYHKLFLQDGIDLYNKVLGGDVKENGEKLKGINECINLYRQQNKGENVPFLAPLDKQILSEKEKFRVGIETDEELEETLRRFQSVGEEKVSALRKLIEDFTLNNERYDLSKVWFSKKALNTITHKWLADELVREQFESALYAILQQKEVKAGYEALRKPEDAKIGKDETGFKFPDFIALEHIKEALENLASEQPWKPRYYQNDNGGAGVLTGREPRWDQFLHILSKEFFSLFERQQYVEGKSRTVGYDHSKQAFDDLLKQEMISVESENKAIIKAFADDVKMIYQMGMYFAVEKKREWREEYELDVFYTDPQIGYQKFYRSAYQEIIQTYNDLRNYLTKKPWEEKRKWKLNFENSTLADGWDKNKEKENSTVILRKDGKYYLAIMRKGHNKLFDEKNLKDTQSSEKSYEKMVYKLLANPSRMIPKCTTQRKEVKKHFENSANDYVLETKEYAKPLRISKSVFELNNYEYKQADLQGMTGGLDTTKRVKANSNNQNQYKLFQKEFKSITGNDREYRTALAEWIEFCKAFLNAYKSTSEFLDFSNLKPTKEYASVDEFYRDVEKASYMISFRGVSEEYIKEKNQKGELYLFQIHNKDWNDLPDGKKKTGAKNLHTLYFESVFSEENKAKDFIVKLNGEAELFFRPKLSEDKLGTQTDSKGEKVVKHKRYAEDKFFFHCPITLNRGAGGSFGFNERVNAFLANNPDVNIIGIDRGEKHLAYYSVIDQQGNILEMDTLNTVHKIPFEKLLKKRAEKREKARKDWQAIEDIKDLKQGYISHVVRKMADLALRYNAIIVLEDLNMGFKQVRGGIEQSVYQQLEKALIEKLNFLVTKQEKDPDAPGHVLKPYQLTAPVDSFKDMGKQTGIMFYTQAGYTSKTCPQCGFRRNLRFKYENMEQARELIGHLKQFVYNPEADRFEITYHLSDYTNGKKKSAKKKKENVLFEDREQQNEFTLYSDTVRYKWHGRNSAYTKERGEGEEEHSQTESGVVKRYDITACLKRLFEENGIDYDKGQLNDMIFDAETDASFFKTLLYYLSLLTETRVSISGTDVDCIKCPCCRFDSEDGFQGKEYNGDANGAYNVARKGIMMLEKINQYAESHSPEAITWKHLFIDVAEWDKFTQT